MTTRRRRDAPSGAVPSITAAPVPLGEDQARRTRRYLIQMGIRLVCFVAAILVGGGWLTWVLVGAAVVLPYTAVLLANAGRDQAHYDVSPMEYRELPSAPAAAGLDGGTFTSAGTVTDDGRVADEGTTNGEGTSGPAGGTRGDD